MYEVLRREGFKSAENCFIEIINFVQKCVENKTQSSTREPQVTSSICYSKLRQIGYDELHFTNYYFEGHIDVSDEYLLHFYFSKSKTMLSIEGDVTEETISKLQYYLLLIADKLIIRYSIEIFLRELANER